jgi:hypothetical protein
MNSNTLRVELEFSFKGETFNLDEAFDLDQITVEPGDLPDFHRLLARKAGIDPISYLYEVLESHDLHFFAATGLAADFCHKGQFDWHGFEQARREDRDWEHILAIVQGKFTPNELDASPSLKAALLAVYQAASARKQG